MYKLILGLLLTAATLLTTSMAQAVMAPHVYAEKSMNSKIKAIAVIEKIEKFETGRYFSTMRATFTTKYAQTKDTPETFTATYVTVETDEQKKNSIAGGYIYFYPEKDTEYYVTVSEEGGSITSLTKLTKDLENAIKNAPETIDYGFSKARLK